MRKNRLFSMTLLAAVVSLGGCYRFARIAGPPCMGNACPAGTKGEPPAAQHAEYKQPPASDQPASASAPAEPAAANNQAQGSAAASNSTQQTSEQSKPGRFTRMLEALHLHSKS